MDTTRSNTAEKPTVSGTEADLLCGVTFFPTTLNHQQVEKARIKSYIFADISSPVGTGPVTNTHLVKEHACLTVREAATAGR